MPIRKFTVSDFNLKTDGLPAEQKAFMENIVGMMCEVVNKSLEGIASPDEVSKQFDDINKLLKSYDNEKFQQLVKDNEELVAQVKTLGESMLKSRVYIRSYILNMLPEAVWMAEDWNILFGDGNGENLLGIINNTGVTSVEKIISTAIVTGAAGAVKAITGYNGDKDVIVEFAEPQDLILDGMSITFAGAAVLTELNKTHALVKMEDGRILIPGVAFSGAETATDKMTFSVHEAGFKNIEEPNSEDVVKTAFAAMTYAQYFPNAIILNPMTVNGMESEKDTTGRNLGIVKMVDGVKYIAGRPIIEYGGILPGKYLLGDFNQAANLVDYTTLTLEWAEDVETKLCNEVVLMAQEEVIFPIYMPWAFAYGDLAALKTAITKA